MTDPHPLPFLADGGEVGALMRAHDWSRSPLGAPETWPQSLRSIVGLMLGSKFPMFVAWGPELGFLYNDSYAEVLGAKHPAAIGDHFHDIWAEIWPDISPLIDAALAGRASYHEDLPLLMHRRGYDEQTWFTFSYSPVRDESGAVAGMFCACQETTGRVLAERRIAAEGRRFAELFDQAPAFMAVLRGPDHRFELVNPPYQRLIGDRDVIGRPVAEALPETTAQGYLDLLDEVYRTGKPYTASGARLVFRTAPDASSDERFLDFVYQPITDIAGEVSGVLVQGVDVTAAHRAQDALRESEDHYRHAVELDPQTTWTSAPDGQLDHVNHRWFEWTGTTGLGETWADGLHVDDRQRTFDVWGRSVATGEPYDIEHRVKMLDGTYRWMHSRAYPRRDDEGRIVKWYGTTEDIHDRKLAEHEREESEARLRALAENLPLAVAFQLETSLDRTRRRYTFVSGNAKRLLGIDADEAMAQTEVGFGRLHPDDVPAVVAAAGQALRRRDTLDLEVRYLRPDGRRIRGRVVARPREADGRILWDGLFLDVTERREREERERFLLELADRLREAGDAQGASGTAAELLGHHLGAARVVFGEIDQARRVTRVTRDWVGTADVPSLAGLEAPLDTADPLLLVEARAGRTLVLDDVAADARVEPRNVEAWGALGVRAMVVVPLVRAGALRATLNVHAAEPRNWTGGEVELIEAVAERTWDAVERARAEAALREETRTLETLNRVGAALAGELDLERLVQMVTDAGVELTGAKFGAYFHNILDETGEQLYLFTLSGAARSDFEKLGRVRATGVFGPTFRNEGVVRSHDILTDPRYGQLEPHRGMPEGHLPVRSYMGVPVVSRSGEVLGGLIFGHPEPGRFTDRHERLMVGVAAQAAVAIDNARLFQQVQQANETLEQRVAERTLELEEAHDALRQSQKMEAVGQLTGGIAHDFNNMLAVVVGSLDLLGRRLPADDARARRYLDAAADGARRAAQLTQRLLAFSRQQPLRPEPVDANELVGGMADLLRHSLGPDVQLELGLASDLWLTHADPNQLENAILNLAVNARDAMAGDGRLTVETRNVQLDGRERPGDYVLICVSDTGQGMSDEVIAKAFDPFFTTKEVGKGTGLGLSQVYGFVQQSGGHIRIQSEVGRGTTIRLYLPRYAGPVGRARAAEDAPAPRSVETSETVLVVEDEPAVRQYSVDALGELGYRVLEADGAVAALRLLDAHPEVGLLFTDVVMPEVNGAKLAEEARRRRPDLRVLFTTGYTRDAVLGDGGGERGAELLAKPFTIEELAAKVRFALDAPRPVPADADAG